MGKNTKLVATVIPVSYNADKKELTVSVNITPRLPDSGLLEEYPEILNWPDYYSLFQKEISFYFWPLDENDYSLGSGEPLIGRKTRDFLPDSDKLWRAMFDKNTIVSGWVINELPYELSERLTNGKLKESIGKALDETIDQLMIGAGTGDPDDPYSTDGKRSDRREEMASLVTFLRRLRDEKQVSTILADPILTDPIYKPYLGNLLQELRKINAAMKVEFDDMLVRLSVQEVEKRNYEETSEFHKRFAAYANHPFLLKETGWIMDYTIDMSKHPGFVISRLYIQAVPQADVEAQAAGENKRSILKASGSGVATRNNNGFPTSFEAFIQEIDWLYPITCMRISDVNANNEAISRALLMDDYKSATGNESLLEINPQSGYIKIKTDHYEASANLVDKNQLLARIESLLQINFSGTSDSSIPVDRRNRMEVISGESISLSQELAGGSQSTEYISNGIALDIRQLKDLIDTQIQISPENILEFKKKEDGSEVYKQQLSGSGIIYQQNVVAGYRVDVISILGNDSNSYREGSLCMKDEYFLLKGAPPVEAKCSEGWLVESTQASNSGRIYVDEELFRWNDWSLAASQYGNHNPEEEKDLCNENLLICTWPCEGSLVPLRFGRRYSFALRPVDIIGGGQTPVDSNRKFDKELLTGFLQTFGYDEGAANQLTVQKAPTPEIKDYWTKPVIYQRVDAINTPMVFLADPLLHKSKKTDLYNPDEYTNGPAGPAVNEPLPDWLDHRWGEDINTMVIRSYFKNGGMLYDPGSATRRYIGPPRANLNFVMQHGALDEYLAEIENASSDEKINNHRNEILDIAEVEINTNMQYVLREQRADAEKIFYLYDPLVCGFEFVADGLVYRAPRSGMSFCNNAHWWRNQRFIRFDLDKADSFTFSPANLFWRIGLNQGGEKIITISCLSDERIEATAGPQQDFFLRGIAKIRRSQLKAVHAVQKPCLLNEKYPANGKNFMEIIGNIFQASVTPRLPGGTDVSLMLSLGANQFFPVYTADSYFLHAESYDFIPDRSITGGNKGYRLERIRKIARSGFQPIENCGETNAAFDDLLHYFDDTKHRRVNYRLEAVSAFRKYFSPKVKGGFSVYGDVNTWLKDDEPDRINDERFLKDADRWLNILSSKQPDTPVIDRIVPLIHWEEEGSSFTRTCNTVRIYLQGNWYSSGPDEKLAILYTEDNAIFNSSNILYFDPAPPAGADPEVVLDGAISQLGKDPAAAKIDFGENNTVQINTALIDRSYFNPGEWTDPVELSIEDLEADKPDSTLIKGLKVKALPLSVRYLPPGEAAKDDPEAKGQFYVDIPFKNDQIEKYYFPFVRFAIARYQANAIIDKANPGKYKFSKVVVTNFVQLLPKRKIIVNKAAGLLEYSYHPESIRKRKDETATNNLYVMKEQFSGERSLFGYHNDQPAKPDLVDNRGKITIRIPDFKSEEQLIVAEYEEYQVAAGDLMPGGEDPRIDFTKRLVFSYTIKYESVNTDSHVKN